MIELQSMTQNIESTLSQDQKNLKKVIPLILKLQDQKSKLYGRSYCRHGELSIFFNLERKWDRLANMMEGAMKSGVVHTSGTPDEPFIDTVVDLASYALLWAGYISETHPEVLDAFIKAHNLADEAS